VSHFLNKYRAEYRHQIQGISRGALAMFQNYDWPGNIRELEHALLQIMVLHGEKPVIEEGDLPLFLERRSPEHKRRFQQDALEVQLSLDDYAREFVRMFESQSTERELAQALGVTPKTLWQKRQKWNLKRRSRTGKDHPG
jgi:transcriptional regulator with PAS, ATPase and Fis domain